MANTISRIIGAFNPPIAPKSSETLKFGILGAAAIASLSLIGPAKSHPEVVIQAIAARDREKAQIFAKANGIPEVKDSYQEMLNDPNIDVIYIPLPNAYHYEWAVKSIKAGKHVLLEKPSVNNAIEAEVLFNLPELKGPNAPVLLEGMHMLFYPSFQFFKSLMTPENIEHIYTNSMIPHWYQGKEAVCFNYSLGSGCMMAVGTYNMTALRQLFNAEPIECISCETHQFPEEKFQKIDIDFKAEFRFPNGGIGVAESTLVGSNIWWPSKAVVTNKEILVSDNSLPAGQQKFLKKELTLFGVLNGILWHRIDIKDVYTIRDGSKVVKTWTENKSLRSYTFKEAGGDFADFPGEEHWFSFRHMLEQFVNKIKGRPTQTWITGQDSINQAKMLDMAYEKSGLGIRQTCPKLEEFAQL